MLFSIKKKNAVQRHQPFSCGHHLVDTLFLCDMRQTLHTQLRARCNALSNSAVSRQHGSHSNSKLSRHLVGTLTAFNARNKQPRGVQFVKKGAFITS